MQVEQKFFIGAQDVGAGNKVRNKALLEMLSNVAIVHANAAGQGWTEEMTRTAVWVVLHWKLEVYRRAGLCEVLTARTWCADHDRLRAYRDYELLDRDGQVVAKATSDWTALDPVKGSLIRLSPEWMAQYQCEPDKRAFPGYEFPRREIPAAAEPLRTGFFTVNHSMIDYNHHVHNTAYMDLVDEILPEGLEEAGFDHVEITYKKEARLGDRLLLEYRACSGEEGIAGNAGNAGNSGSARTSGNTGNFGNAGISENAGTSGNARTSEITETSERNTGTEHLIYVKSEDGKVLHTIIKLY